MIGSLADRIRADVIVLVRQRNRQPGSAMGGTALAVVTNASSPCLVVVLGDASAATSRVCAPAISPIQREVRFSSAFHGHRRCAAAYGRIRQAGNVVLPRSMFSRLRPGHTSSPPEAIERELEYIRQKSGTWAGVSIRARTAVSADVARGIVAYVGENASDLVVMGTRGLGLDPVGRLGSITASAMTLLTAPALLVPPAVWMTHARAS